MSIFVRFFFACCFVAVPLLAPGIVFAEETGLSPSRLSLPRGPGSLEGVGENVDVDVNMGLMSYAVPIAVPSGYGALSPQLGLRYSSGAGSGVVGIGWSMSVPAIERTSVRGLPLYDREDTFAADGSQELVRLSATGAIYRARFEGGFVRYTWLAAGDGSGGYWQAEYPDGRIGWFGADASGAIDENARVRGPTGVFRWHLVELRDPLGHSVRYSYRKSGSYALLSRVSYVGSRYLVELGYEARPDEISDARPGFDLRLVERVSQIRVLVRGVQLRRYALSYEDTSRSGGLSRLTRVEQYGVGDEGPHPIRFSFQYGSSECTSAACTPYLTAMGSVGADLRAGDADFIDLNGDSLPDVVDTSGTTHTVHASAITRFELPAQSRVADGGAAQLASPLVELVDLNGDGFTDLVDGANRRVLYNRGLEVADWSEEASIADLGLPDFSADSQLRFFDYDGDGRIDVMHAGTDGTWFYRNDGDSFSTVATPGQPIGMGVADGLRFADMNGDGLQDAVAMAAGLLRYRIYLGYGRWGDWVEVDGMPLDLPPSGFELIDLDGDALSDLVSVEAGEISYARNENGRLLAQLAAISDATFPVRTAEMSVRFLDMNGSGSTDVVWIEPDGEVTYLELFPIRPNLLERIDNGLGRSIRVVYGSSAQHMARDGGAIGWRYRLPQAMLTVDRIEEHDGLSPSPEVRTYAYHHGYWDGVERQFRGFEEVEVSFPGDATSEATEERYEFDVGADDVYRKGKLLRLTRVGASGRVLDVTTRAYEDCSLTDVPVTDPAIRSVCETSLERQLREGLADASQWVTTREEYRYDGFGNRTFAARLGVAGMGADGTSACAPCTGGSDVFGAACDASCRGDESYERTTYVDPRTATGGRWILRAASIRSQYGVEGGANAEERTYYDGAAYTGLSIGALTLGLVTRVSARVDTSLFVDTARNRYDTHGNVVEARDGNGHARRFEYDADGLMPVAESVVFDDRAQPYELRLSLEHGSPIEQPIRSTDWHMASDSARARLERSTAYSYDAFGRLTAIARPGDAIDWPTEEFGYELGAPLSRIVRRARSASGGQIDVEEIQCFDGRGRARQTRAALEPGRYQVSGFAAFDARGHTAREYQPYVSSTGACDRVEPTGVRATEQHFDAAGRLVRAVLPDGDERGAASERTQTYLPLATLGSDEEDTDPSSVHADTPTLIERDGLDRIVRIERRLAAQSLVTEIRYDELGNLRGYIDPQGIEKTQEHDRLGRVVRVLDVDSGETTFQYDAAGNVVARTDARGITTRFAHDEGNRVLMRWDEASPMRTRTTWHYDRAQRCDATRCLFLEGRLAAIDYPIDDGEIGSDALGYDARGRQVLSVRALDGHRFEIGTVYDNLDRAIGRRFPFGRALDFTLDGAGRLRSVPGYVENVGYDARGDLASFTLGNGARTSYANDALRRLSSLRTTLPSGLLAQDYRYERDRVGNILAVRDSAEDDGTPSQDVEHAYDSLYRLTSSRLDAGRATEETLTFAYDDGDNILSMESSGGAASAGHVGAYEYGVDRPHAVVRAGETSYGYDAAGQMILRGQDSYRWDHLGRLIDARRESQVLASFAYGDGVERVRKTEGDSTTYYVAPDYEVRDGVASIYVRLGDRRVARIETHDWQAEMYPDLAPARMSGTAIESEGEGRISSGDAWIDEAIRQGILTSGVVPEETTGALLAAVTQRLVTDPPPVVTYFHHDHLGTSAVVSDANARIINRSARYPFGALRFAHAEVETAATFTGHEQDLATGLHYAHARYLDTTTGRWLTPDPSFELLRDASVFEGEDVSRRMAYASNRPTVAVDDSGRAINYLIGAVAGGVLAGGMEVLKAHLKGEQVNWSKVGTAAAFGALSGFATGGLTTARTAGQLGMMVLTEVNKELVPVAAGRVAQWAGASRETGKLVEDVAAAAFAVSDLRSTAQRLGNLDRVGNYAGSISSHLRNLRADTTQGLLVTAVKAFDDSTSGPNDGPTLLEGSPIGRAGEALGRAVESYTGSDANAETNDAPSSDAAPAQQEDE